MLEARRLLQCRSESVDLRRLGIDCTWKHDEIGDTRYLLAPGKVLEKAMVLHSIPEYNDYKRYLVAQALMDNLANTEAGLSIRWAMPYDFSDDEDNLINDWSIPNNRTFQNTRECIWKRYRRSDCILIWGFGRGYNSSGLVTSACIMRSNVKTIEVVGLSQLEKGKVAVLQTPCMFKRLDNMEIHVTLPETGYGKKDEIVIYAFICEMIGNRQTG